MRRERFSWTLITETLGISVKTVKRRLIESNITNEFSIGIWHHITYMTYMTDHKSFGHF